MRRLAMDCRMFWGAFLGFALLSGTSVVASTITYKAEEVVFDGLPVYSGMNSTLPDFNAGGSVTLTGFGYQNSQVAAGGLTSSPISGVFGFLIQGFDSSGNAVGSLMSVEGQYQGTFTSGGLPGRESASFTGVATFVGSHFGDPVPEALQNLAGNPSRLTVASVVSLGPSGDTNESVILTIAPQATPEPSTLVSMVSILGVALIYRNRRRK